MSDQSEYLKKVKVKLERYCAYQDRCEFEVLNKLKSFELSQSQIDSVVDHLIESAFLDEARFVESYVNGKLKVKKWGRIKIKSMLMQKRVSSTLINQALDRIDPDLYAQIARELALKKRDQIKSKEYSEIDQKQKISQYLMSKGFEWDVISIQLFD